MQGADQGGHSLSCCTEGDVLWRASTRLTGRRITGRGSVAAGECCGRLL